MISLCRPDASLTIRKSPRVDFKYSNYDADGVCWSIDWLNYHHLHYFWVVARHGSVTRASELLRLSPPTISTQINRLEAALGHKLFVRRGRNLVLTELGQLAAKYADQIFSLGESLVDAMKGRSLLLKSFKRLPRQVEAADGHREDAEQRQHALALRAQEHRQAQGQADDRGEQRRLCADVHSSPRILACTMRPCASPRFRC